MGRLIDEDFVKRRMHETMDYQDLYLPVHFEMCMRDAPTVAASPWHRVEDEMPKDGLIGKLVIDTEGQINICRGYATITLTNGSVVLMDDRILDVFKEETDSWNWDDVTHFTHWMPLPEPPKEDA